MVTGPDDKRGRLWNNTASTAGKLQSAQHFADLASVSCCSLHHSLPLHFGQPLPCCVAHSFARLGHKTSAKWGVHILHIHFWFTYFAYSAYSWSYLWWCIWQIYSILVLVILKRKSPYSGGRENKPKGVSYFPCLSELCHMKKYDKNMVNAESLWTTPIFTCNKIIHTHIMQNMSV